MTERADGVEIRLLPEDRSLARRMYAAYAEKEGAQHIASETALAYLSACLRWFQPAVVLECGAGIGTMTDTVLSHSCGVRQIVSLEQDAFCLRALVSNLSHHDPARFRIITSRKDLAEAGVRADLLLEDGGWESEEEFRTLGPGGVVFVEGIRRTFREKLASHLSTAVPPTHITFTEYGARRGFKVFYSRRFRIPLPRIVRRVTLKKGCWVGIIQRNSA